MYETFDHTADLGLRVVSPDLNSLFADAGLGLSSLIVEDVTSVKPAEEHRVVLCEEDREYLLFDWLKELLYRFDGEHLLFSRFDVEVSDAGLTAAVWGEPLDTTRHELDREVKAITYHDLTVREHDGGWLAEVIVDI